MIAVNHYIDIKIDKKKVPLKVIKRREKIKAKGVILG